MEILNEIEETVCKMDIDMSEEEIGILVDYYDSNCPEEEKQNVIWWYG